jgi:hypothetical protein
MVNVPDEEMAHKILRRLDLVFGYTINHQGCGTQPLRFDIERGESERVFVREILGEAPLEFASADFVNSFEALVRIRVAEYAPDHVFIHAGVVSIGGQALVLPGRSRTGKSSLVKELVSQGAIYYSDEYAVLDSGANVLPFPKPLSIRTGSEGVQEDLDPACIGATGTETVPCGMVLLTEFQDSAIFAPERLSPASGIMEVLKHTVPVRRNAKFSLKVLKKLTLRAIIVQSYRAESNEVAINLINYFNREVINTS